MLPTSTTFGHFHTGPETDQFQLPVWKTWRTCTVKVELAAYSLPEGGSWMYISDAARMLNERCKTRVVLAVSGGRIYTGVHDRIKIDLVRRGRGGGGEGLE